MFNNKFTNRGKLITLSSLIVLIVSAYIWFNARRFIYYIESNENFSEFAEINWIAINTVNQEAFIKIILFAGLVSLITFLVLQNFDKNHK